jgi:DNA-3-methyladenine glycosylase II
MEMRLTEAELARGVRALCRRDPDLARVVARHGPPPLWARPTGFATLVQIMLEQQVSLASARAAYARLTKVVVTVAPDTLAALDDRSVIEAGLTRQKAAYLRALGQAVARGELEVDRLASLDDNGAHAELLKLKGIGPWSADIYLLMALGRRNVWPRNDLALAAAMHEVKRLRQPPTLDRQLALSESWRPWRAVAARILWHHYLSTPRRRPQSGTRNESRVRPVSTS